MRKEQFAVGHYYHIYNRGVADSIIFRNERDYQRFLQALFVFNDVEASPHILRRLGELFGKPVEIMGDLKFPEFLSALSKLSFDNREPLVNVLSYCFVPTHFHLELEQLVENGISIFMHKIGTGYTNYFNKRYERQGSLLQGPFKAVLIENEIYLKHLSVYINALNPIDLVEPGWRENGIQNLKKTKEFIENYKWSSYPDYIDLRKNNKVIEKGILKDLFPTPQEYKKFTEEYLKGKQNLSFLEGLILE